MLAFRLRWVAVAALIGVGMVGAVGACGGQTFTLLPAADGGSGDGGGGDDGGVGVDALAEAEAGPPGFCASLPMPKPFLCDDFDERANDLKGLVWDSVVISPDANGLIDGRDSKSPPRSLLVETTHGGIVNTQEEAVLVKDVGHAKTIEIGFDVKLVSYGGNNMSFDKNGCFLMEIGYGGLGYELIVLSPSAIVFNEDISPDGGAKQSTTTPISTGLAIGMWTHIDTQITLPQGATQGKVVITIDGRVALTQTLTFLSPTPSTAQVALGLVIANAPDVWSIRYDNVTIDRTM